MSNTTSAPNPATVSKALKSLKTKMFYAQSIDKTRLYSNLVNKEVQDRYNNCYSTFKSLMEKGTITLSKGLNKLERWELSKSAKVTHRATATDEQKEQLAFMFAVNELVGYDQQTSDDLEAQIIRDLKSKS